MSEAPIYNQHTMRVVRQMRKDGANTRLIAAAIGSTPGSLRATLHRKGITKRHDGRLDLNIGEKLKERLYTEATARGMNQTAFTRLLLKRIATDNLFNAILDDGR